MMMMLMMMMMVIYGLASPDPFIVQSSFLSSSYLSSAFFFLPLCLLVFSSVCSVFLFACPLPFHSRVVCSLSTSCGHTFPFEQIRFPTDVFTVVLQSLHATTRKERVCVYVCGGGGHCHICDSLRKKSIAKCQFGHSELLIPTGSAIKEL